MISYCKSLRLERSGRKQSRETPEMASYPSNNHFSDGLSITKIYWGGAKAQLQTQTNFFLTGIIQG